VAALHMVTVTFFAHQEIFAAAAAKNDRSRFLI